MDYKLMITILEEIKDNQKETVKKVDDLRQEVRDDITEVRREQRDLNKAQADHNSILARQQVILEEHMRRTATNEEQLQLQRELVEQNVQELRTEISPLKTHVAMWGGAAKVLTIIGALGGLAVAVVKVMGGW